MAFDPQSAATKQTPTDNWLVTYVKDKAIRTFPCGGDLLPPADSSTCNISNREVFYELKPGVCECVRTQNYFIQGSEFVKYGFKHKAVVTLQSGSTRVRALPRTKIWMEHVDPDSETLAVTGEVELVQEREAGSQISIGFSAHELMQWARLDLDDPDPTVATGTYSRKPRVGNPSFRMTGIVFDVRVIYSGNLKGEGYAFETDENGLQVFEPEANVYITPVGGWHSKGPDVQFVEYPSDPSKKEFTMHDRYARGVHIRVTFGGAIEFNSQEFEFIYFTTQLAGVLVYFSLASTLVTCILQV